MSLRQSHRENDIEYWVCKALDRQASNVDATAIIARARQLASVEATPSPPRRSPRLAWRALAAAAVFAVAFCSLSFRADVASAESLVMQALQVASRPLDRCYLIESDLGAHVDGAFQFKLPNKALLWARGDRFLIELPMPAIAGKSKEPKQLLRLGRDELGRLWVALDPQNGLRFELKDLQGLKGLADRLKTSLEMYSINDEALLRTILKDYDLSRKPRAGERAGEAVKAVEAAARSPKRQSLPKKARLEFDYQDNVLRRATLQYRSNTITFTLKETSEESKSDGLYELESYLSTEGLKRLNSRGNLSLQLLRLAGVLQRDQ